uniref:UDP-glucosyltransferase UGT87N1 n=1 Tax=Polygala tenuifolia TaxID=355332 RepID=A0A3G3NBI7_9FABA|nr:UDP-glucosyltransferase UGT87N1 [Polygala tenuifolia]
MDFLGVKDSSKMCHLVAVPLPLRSLINPMMNFCKLLSSREPYSLLITVVLTEEWFGYIGSEPKPDNIKFATIPNVVEFKDTRDPFSFIHAITTEMEAPFEELLDALQPQVSAIVADVELGWPIDLGNRRNIPVAVSNTTSASFFSMMYQYALFTKNRLIPFDFLNNSDDQTDMIPGVSSIQLADVQAVIDGTDKQFMQIFLKSFSKVSEAQYLIFTSVHELEVEAFNSLKASFPFPVLPIGPAIPYMELEENACGTPRNTVYYTEHKKWLDCQPFGSVLYIAFGSASSISSSQMEEIVEALNCNGFWYFWVAREEAPILREKCSERGLIVSWCDQLKVLSHSSICGFWSHCGWNSTLEAVFAGVPMLTFPLFLDQVPNSRKIVDEWKTGWRVKKQELAKDLVGRDQISELVKRFMDAESLEVQDMRKKAKKLKNICQQAIKKGGSSDINLDAFIKSILGSGFTACQ